MTKTKCKCLRSHSSIFLILVNNVNKICKQKGSTLSIIDIIFFEYNKKLIYDCVHKMSVNKKFFQNTLVRLSSFL